MKVFLSLGSNRGDRAANLDAAVAGLPRQGVRVERVSAYLPTPPDGATGRRWFLNCVLEGETALPPRVLLARLLGLERQLDRHRPGKTRRKLPRTVDIDVIFYGRTRLRSAVLTVPHSQFAARRFVLAPLAELAPRLRPPGNALTVQRLLTRLPRARLL